MVQVVKLFHKHGGLSSNPRTTGKIKIKIYKVTLALGSITRERGTFDGVL
jgi:hypothetical protein